MLNGPTCYHRVTRMNVQRPTGYGAFSLFESDRMASTQGELR
jgi:hypothetical protein